MARESELAFLYSILLRGQVSKEINMFCFSRENLEGKETLVTRRQRRATE